MWLWIIIIAAIIGGIIGFFGGDGNSDDALEGCLGGGCMTGYCLGRIFITGLSILFCLWLFKVLFL